LENLIISWKRPFGEILGRTFVYSVRVLVEGIALARIEASYRVARKAGAASKTKNPFCYEWVILHEIPPLSE